MDARLSIKIDTNTPNSSITDKIDAIVDHGTTAIPYSSRLVDPCADWYVIEGDGGTTRPHWLIVGQDEPSGGKLVRLDSERGTLILSASFLNDNANNELLIEALGLISGEDEELEVSVAHPGEFWEFVGMVNSR